MKLTPHFCWIVAAVAFAAPGHGKAADYAIPPAKKDHWAWKGPVRPPVPPVTDRAWVTNPIDAFVLAKLEAAKLSPAPPASREHLLRRVTFDLIGLPPTPDEIDAFINDPSPRAWEKVVDRLLASPHYGERWGRHWLDLARYAESNGYEHDEIRPGAWRYRDYVVRAFNADKPFDRFIKEQIAGDELYPGDVEALIATGFNLLGPDMTDAANQAQRRQNTLDDMTDTTGLVFLGMTIGCARCHDHKFEPIPQKDFYRLQAFFAPAVFRRDLPLASPEAKAAHERALKEHAALVKPLQAEIARLGKSDKGKLKELQDQLKKLDARKPASLPTLAALQETITPATKTFLLRRGELKHPGEEVDPGYPIILVSDNRSLPAKIPALPASTGRRSALAAWLASPENPLTARVLVNRLWQHHFGRGIVPTPSEFGVRGQLPTHPELLDWLATEFVAQGWSVKKMHRLMLLSSAYRQSTTAAPQALRQDPDNLLFSRMNRLRLEGEVIRDSLLAVSGRLNATMGGPGVFPPLPPEVREGLKGWTVSADKSEHVRRSMYIFARRNLRFTFLEAFDLPDSTMSCPKRERSTTALQALTLLNSPEVTDAARALAQRVEREAGSADECITLAYRLVLGRQPSAEETSLAREFLRESPLTELCRALFNVNEFVYPD
ncbi:MAG TPA: DUF1549 and DUF1553 domain-containing protein [Gemmataceae bacterium]|nr:DUF1549 and DUF1553 domain-containing protein [Gemmataceae bacterium]